MWFPASIFKAQKYAAKFLPASSEGSANRCWALRGALAQRGMWVEHQQVTKGAGASVPLQILDPIPF